MATSDFGLSSLLENTPQIDLGGILPSNPVTGPPRQTPIIVNAPRAQSALERKYSTYMRDLQSQYDPVIIKSMMDYDAQRVKSGQSPLSEDETRRAMEAARTSSQPTPEPKRGTGIGDLLTNAVGDIRDIVTSIPKLPMALIHEGQALGDMGSSINSAPNPIAGILRAPLVRLLPGAFTAGNIAAGDFGELVRHPVNTLLDILPAAAAAAKMSEVSRLATKTAEFGRTLDELPGDLKFRDFRKIDAMAERPISTTLLNKVSEDGNIIRNAPGEMMDTLRETKIGQFINQSVGRNAKDVAFIQNSTASDLMNMLNGTRAPKDAIELMAKTSHDVRSMMKEVAPDLDMAGHARIKQAMTDDNLTNLSDTELAAVEVYNQALNTMTTWALDNDKLLRIEGEMYDWNTGNKILQKTKETTRKQMFTQYRTAIETGDHASAIDGLIRDLDAPRMVNRALSAKDKARAIMEGQVVEKEVAVAWTSTKQSLKNAGYDTTILEQLASKKGPGIASDTFRRALDDVRSGRTVLPPRPAMAIDELMAYARSNMGSGSVAYRDLVRGVERREWKGVTDALDSLRNTDVAFQNGVKNLRDTDRLLQNKLLSRSTPESLAKSEASLKAFKTQNQSARFLPKQQELMREGIANKLIDKQQYLPVGDRYSTERILALRDRGELAGIPGFTPKMFRQERSTAAATIEKMKAEGFDPIFVHTVTPNRVQSSFRFNDNIVPVTPAAVRERMADMSPGINDVGIAINDMALQYLAEPLAEARLHRVADQFGYTLEEINQITHETASYRSGKSSALSYEGHKQKVIAERYRALDPEDLGMAWGSPYISQLKTSKVYVPIDVYRTLKAMTEQKPLFGGLLDPVTKLFRISTTALSLRTQIYNLVGGPASAFIENPRTALYYGKAKRMIASGEVPEQLQEILGGQLRSFQDLSDLEKGVVTEGVRKYLVGKKMKGWWDEMQAAKTPGKTITGRFGDKFNGLIEKSYELNGIIDDHVRAASYLAEYDAQVAKGASGAYAEMRAISKTRQVLQDWLGMTPMERNVMKSLLPFYGFISHAIRFVMRYPLDHPLRAEIMSKLAEAELEDNNQGLPSRFISSLFFGAQDDNGNQSALNLGPFNPFGDVANSMTLAGFIGNTNPIIQTAFEMIGVNQGEAELYPSLRYDPNSGRMEATHPGLIESLVGNVIPTSSGILALMGLNSEYNQTLRRDPEAAGRYLLSALTVPTLERQYNIPQEQFAAEVARGKSANTVLNAALKSGDWSEAMLYPSLGKYLDALNQLPDEDMQQFAPITKEDAAQIAQQALDTGQTSGTKSAPTLDDLVQAQLGTGVGTGIPQQAVAPTFNLTTHLAVGGALGLNGI